MSSRLDGSFHVVPVHSIERTLRLKYQHQPLTLPLHVMQPNVFTSVFLIYPLVGLNPSNPALQGLHQHLSVSYICSPV